MKTAGRVFGISRRKAYELVRSGNFPCEALKVGSERIGYKVVTADMLRVLRVQESTEDAMAA